MAANSDFAVVQEVPVDHRARVLRSSATTILMVDGRRFKRPQPSLFSFDRRWPEYLLEGVDCLAR